MTMAPDAAGHLVFFGGVDPNGNFYNDTWTWDGANWTQQLPTNSPPARDNAAIAYDSVHGQVVLFGGNYYPAGAANQVLLNDTWTWDGKNWTQQFPVTSPPIRELTIMANDQAGHLVLFGGFNFNNGFLADTWFWNGTNWAQQFPANNPIYADGAQLAYDTVPGHVVYYAPGVTWVWDGITWTQESPATSLPARCCGTLVYDSNAGLSVGFGGQNITTGGYYNDTWAWNGVTWTQETPANSPAPRYAQSSAYDPTTGQIVLYGGKTDGTQTTPASHFSDTWTYQLGAYSFAGVNVCPSGQTTPAPCSQTASLTFNISASTTIGQTKVVTQGLSNLDFSLVPAGTTCNGALTAPTSCTVEVQFAPLAPGVRSGAVELYDNLGNLLFAEPLYGQGLAAAVAFPQGAQSIIQSGSNQFRNLGMDAAGDLFVAQYPGNVVEYPFGGGSPIQIAPGYFAEGTFGVAVDGAGDVFITDTFNTSIAKVPAGCTTNACVIPFATAGSPNGLAVDGAGDLFLADTSGSVLEIPAGCTTNACKTKLGSGWSSPQGLAVDAAGNLYVADSGLQQVIKVPAGCTSSVCLSAVGSGLSQPNAVAVDAAGDLYIADSGLSYILEVPAGCAGTACQIQLGSGLSGVDGVTVDPAGDVFVAQAALGNVVEINASQSPALNFASTNVGFTSTDSPKSLLVQNVGNQSLTGTETVGANFKQLAGSGTPIDCASSFSLASGNVCNVGVAFVPTVTGTNTGSVVFTDNALNVSNALQNVSLQGQGVAYNSNTYATVTAPSSAAYGATPNVSVTVTYVSTGAPVTVGSVSLSVDGGSPQVAPVNSAGVATFTLSGLTATRHSLTGNYLGSGSYQASSSFASLVVTQAAPVISPAGGNYSTIQSVTINDANPGVSIYYTTNGSTPSASSTLYTGAITVATSQSISAIALQSGYASSTVATAAYTITFPTAANPTFSPVAGSYPAPPTVAISDAVAGATIYYTTDGSIPTTASAVYAGPITVSSSQVLNAIAVATGYVTSSEGSAAYTIGAAVPSVNYASGFNSNNINLYGAKIANNILALTDGGAGETNVAWFETPVNVEAFTTDFTFQITQAAAEGFTFTLQNAPPNIYAIGGSGGGLGYSQITPSVAVKFDIFSESGESTDSTGFYTGGASPTVPSVDMTSSGVNLKSGDILHAHLTYDGTTLTLTLIDTVTNATFTTATPISIPNNVGGNTAYVGFTGSTGGLTAVQSILTWTYTVGAPAAATAATPAFSVPAGTYATAQTVAISDATTGAAIYYTTNGTTPTTSSTLYSGPITVSITETINAIAVATGYSNSATGTSAYTITLPATTPAFSLAAGTYTSTQTVAISDATAGAAIYYTTNGTAPTTSSTLYSGPITVSTTETINAIAVATGYSNSATGTSAYTITLPAATPAFSLAAGTYTSTQTVAISDATTGAAIYYTTNGATPTTSSTLYSGPITVSTTETINAIAVANGYSNSATGTSAYTITLPAATPAFSLAAGTYTSTQTVAISDATTGAKIYYTTNGTAPTISSTLYSGSFTIAQTETVNAIAVATGYSNSPTATAAYTIAIPQTITFNSLPSQVVGTSLTLTATASSGLTVSYLSSTAAVCTVSGSVANFLTTGTCSITASQAGNSAYAAAAPVTQNFTVAAVSTPVSTVSVNLASVFNVYGIDNNGVAPINGGLDTSSYAYSENLLGTSLTALGVPFTLGAPGVADALSGGTVSIPAGTFTSLNFLATAVYGNFPNQSFVLNFTDGTTSTYVQSISDWCTSQSYAGETLALGMAYRVTPSGGSQNGPCNVYAYSVPIPPGKTVKSFAPPASRNVLVLAVTLTGSLSTSTPTYAPAAGTYATAQSITITDITPGAAIYYTINGSTPTTSSALYSGPITVFATETLNAIAVVTGSANSAIGTAAYIITSPAATPTFSVAAGTYSTAQTVAVSDTTTGAKIYYTTNGTAPTTSSTLYAGPITVSATQTISAIAVATGYSTSAVASAAYTITLPAATPAFSVVAGTYTTAQTVAVSDTTTGAKIYYTTNGTAPTTSSTLYAGPISVSATQTISAIAVATGYSNSAVASAAYTITLPAATPTFSVAAGTYTTAQTVTVSDTTTGAKIYYTTNGTAPTTSSTLYSTPITISTTETVNAIAVATGYSNSAVATATYIITLPTAVSLSSAYNVYGIYADGTTPAHGGFDTSSYAFSSNYLPAPITLAGTTITLGPVAAPDAVTSSTVTLPAGKFAAIELLASTAFGPAINQSFIVKYSDGTTTTFTQNLSDWGSPQHYTGETVVVSEAYRVTPSGTTQAGPWNMYGYTFLLNVSKTVSSITLPSNRNVSVFAMVLLPTAPTAQTITFGTIAAQKAGTNLALTAAASSGLAVTYASSTPSICTVSGGTASLLAAGTCTISASQAGNATYAAAAPISQSFTVSAAASFALSLSSTTLTVKPGASGSVTVTVKPSNGFTGSVVMASSGLPSGVSASFSPITTSSTTTFAITAPAATKIGTYTVTITGTSGTLTSPATLTLSIP